MDKSKLVLLGFILFLVGAFYFFDGEQYFSVAFYQDLYRQSPGYTAGFFFIIYIFATALSLPGATILTLIAGAIFEFWVGLILVSFASTIGSVIAFLVSRWLLRDWVQERFGSYLKTINEGIEREGVFYLFTLRLIPVVPFFVINLAMGLTPMKILPFYWVSQLGMLAGTAVYVNVGVELAGVEELSLKGVLTPGLMFSFILLATFPLLIKVIIGKFKVFLKVKEE